MKVLLTGATGFIGSHLEARLAQSPHVQLRLASRTPKGPGWVAFDAADPATYADALDGVEVLVWLVHGMAEGAGLRAPRAAAGARGGQCGPHRGRAAHRLSRRHPARVAHLETLPGAARDGRRAA